MNKSLVYGGYTVSELLVVIAVIFGLIGWCLNIVKIMVSMSDIITGMFMLRCLGVPLVPLGAVLGWL